MKLIKINVWINFKIKFSKLFYYEYFSLYNKLHQGRGKFENPLKGGFTSQFLFQENSISFCFHVEDKEIDKNAKYKIWTKEVNYFIKWTKK